MFADLFSSRRVHRAKKSRTSKGVAEHNERCATDRIRNTLPVGRDADVGHQEDYGAENEDKRFA